MTRYEPVIENGVHAYREPRPGEYYSRMAPSRGPTRRGTSRWHSWQGSRYIYRRVYVPGNHPPPSEELP